MNLKYWNERAKKQGALYCGNSTHTLKEHYEFYERKKEFLKKWIPEHVRVLDFGCGPGNFSELFKKDAYMGVDVVRSAILMAQGDGYEYVHIKRFSDIIGKYDLIFCMNVLQHMKNPHGVLRAWTDVLKVGHILLMENYKDQASHVFGRSLIDYVAMIDKHFEIEASEYDYFEDNNLIIRFKVHEKK